MWRFLVRATGLLQIVAERPLPFHFRVIRVCALILTEIVTMRACFGVGQIGSLLSRELSFRARRRGRLWFGGRRSFDYGIFAQRRRRPHEIINFKFRFSRALRTGIQWVSVLFFADRRSRGGFCAVLGTRTWQRSLIASL